RPHGVGDLPHPLEVDHARIGGSPGGNHARLELGGMAGQRVVINPFVLLTYPVVAHLKEAAREIRPVAVGQVSAVGEVHGQDPVPGLGHGEVNGHVRLTAGVRLNVDVFTAEEGAGPVDGKLLDDIDMLAPAVPAAARVTFRVFVGE